MLIRYSLSSSVLHTVPTDNSGFFWQILTKKTPIEPSRIVTRMARRTARITAGEEKETKHQAGEGALLSGRRGSLPATCLVGKATSTVRLLIQNGNFPTEGDGQKGTCARWDSLPWRSCGSSTMRESAAPPSSGELLWSYCTSSTKDSSAKMSQKTQALLGLSWPQNQGAAGDPTSLAGVPAVSAED